MYLEDVLHLWPSYITVRQTLSEMTAFGSIEREAALGLSGQWWPLALFFCKDPRHAFRRANMLYLNQLLSHEAQRLASFPPAENPSLARSMRPASLYTHHFRFESICKIAN